MVLCPFYTPHQSQLSFTGNQFQSLLYMPSPTRSFDLMCTSGFWIFYYFFSFILEGEIIDRTGDFSFLTAIYQDHKQLLFTEEMMGKFNMKWCYEAYHIRSCAYVRVNTHAYTHADTYTTVYANVFFRLLSVEALFV